MERRPIASRDTRWADAVAHALAKTGITPNAISVLGMVFAALAGTAFFLTSAEVAPGWIPWLAGAACVQLRLLANLFDGMVAQVQRSASPVGEIYNEVPDRVSDALILVGLGYAEGGCPVLGFSAALLAVFVAYVRAQLAVSGVPQQFVGPMAKAHRMALVTAAAIVAIVLPSVEIAKWTLVLLAAGCVVTAIRRLLSGAAFLRTRDETPGDEP